MTTKKNANIRYSFKLQILFDRAAIACNSQLSIIVICANLGIFHSGRRKTHLNMRFLPLPYVDVFSILVSHYGAKFSVMQTWLLITEMLTMTVNGH
jgi:hypothetical protein